MTFKDTLEAELAKLAGSYEVCGVIDRNGSIYPLGSDTKVLSAIFELVCRPAVYSAGKTLGLEVKEPDKQNHYPDFTLISGDGCKSKIAVDVKTTYRRNNKDEFTYTLGGYASFIRKPHKNIVFDFSDYSEHWVIGFVYNRVAQKKAGAEHMYRADQLREIPLPFSNVDWFLQEKWRISSGKPGSGNTTNIGSIKGRLEDFRAGRGPFDSEAEFLDYWRGYGDGYLTLDRYRALKQR